MNYEKQSAAVRGIDLKWIDFGGDGPPSLLLHGATSLAISWQAWVSKTDIPLHYVALEQRGHGDSAKPETGYSALDMGEDAAAFWDGLDLDPAVVIGASMGGNTGLAMAALRPDLVRALILSDPGYKIPREAIDGIRRGQENAPADFASIDEMMPMLRQRYPAANDEQIAAMVTPNLKTLPSGRVAWKWDANALRQVGEHMGDNLLGVATRVKVPTLIVQAGERKVFPDAAAKELHEAITGSRLITIEGANHNVHAHKQFQFDAEVRKFLRELDIIPPKDAT